MRIAVLTQGRTGYLDAALRAAHEQGDEIMVVAPATNPDTAYGELAMDSFARCLTWNVEPQTHDLAAAVDDFAPDVVVMVSWTRPRSYRRVIAAQKPHVLRALLMDNVWLATPKQWLGRASHRAYVDPVFDCVMVPSERTEFFARRLGFTAADVIRGCWSADTQLFASDPIDGAELARRRTFLSVARLVEHKGADVLAAAYAAYRERCSEPWDLQLAGAGPLASAFAGVPGVTVHGFVQPAAAAQLMHRSSCFVLPSRIEPYGVVVHEAAAAALPMLCTDRAGAVPMFLQDGANGWTVASGDVEAWTSALLRMSTLPSERLGQMSSTSRALSVRITPQLWARNVHEEFARRLAAGPRRRHLS